jgi:predicted enzyme related to lactoylglutathione lyase
MPADSVPPVNERCDLTFYVEVPDVEAALARAEQLGGTRLIGPSEAQPGIELGPSGFPLRSRRSASTTSRP